MFQNEFIDKVEWIIFSIQTLKIIINQIEKCSEIHSKQ